VQACDTYARTLPDDILEELTATLDRHLASALDAEEVDGSVESDVVSVHEEGAGAINHTEGPCKLLML